MAFFFCFVVSSILKYPEIVINYWIENPIHEWNFDCPLVCDLNSLSLGWSGFVTIFSRTQPTLLCVKHVKISIKEVIKILKSINLRKKYLNEQKIVILNESCFVRTPMACCIDILRMLQIIIISYEHISGVKKQLLKIRGEISFANKETFIVRN